MPVAGFAGKAAAVNSQAPSPGMTSWAEDDSLEGDSDDFSDTSEDSIVAADELSETEIDVEESSVDSSLLCIVDSGLLSLDEGRA